MKDSPTLFALRVSLAIQRGVKYFQTYQHEKTYGIEGCKLRLTSTLYVKLLSTLLDKKKTFKHQLFISDELLDYPLIKGGDTLRYFDKMCMLVYEGLSTMIIKPKETTLTGEMVKKWWPCCSFCKPKGYNCFISFCYDFLEFIAQPKIIKLLISKLDTTFQIEQLKIYSDWLENNILAPLNQEILGSRKNSISSMVELILREISNNLCESKTGMYLGWPVIITNKDRKEQLKDFREEMVLKLKESYKNDKRIRSYLKYIEKIESDSEFQSENAWRIDPLTTAFTLRFLSVLHTSPTFTNVFGKYDDHIFQKGLQTLIYLYEGFILRNEEEFIFPSEPLFDGTKYPLFDGCWMNAEIPIGQDYILPDYSLCSSIDVLIALNSINAILNKKDKKIDEILSKSVDYMMNKLENGINKEVLNACIDLSHWDDRQTTKCEFSDIYCVAKILDFLLEYCLFKISYSTSGDTDVRDLSKILSSDTVLNSVLWIIEQQHPNGYWPKISERLLREATKSQQKELNKIFEPYLIDLGIQNIKDDANIIKQRLKEVEEEKLLSFGNSFQCINLLAKYLVVQSIFDYSLQ